MAGHHKFSELTKNFSPERKRWIAAKTAEALAKMDREIHIEPIMLDWSRSGIRGWTLNGMRSKAALLYRISSRAFMK